MKKPEFNLLGHDHLRPDSGYVLALTVCSRAVARAELGCSLVRFRQEGVGLD